MVKRRMFLVLIMLLSISAMGCVTRLVDFTIISTKNIDLARGADFKRGQSRIEGEDKVSIIIMFPTGVPNIKTAIDRAIESVPGAVALLDGVLSVKAWYIPPIFGEQSYVIEGTPLIDPGLVSSKLPSNYIFSKVDKEGSVKETRYLSKVEFESIKKKIGI